MLEQIKQNFPEDFWQEEPEILSHYGKDWTQVFPAKPLAVVFPRSVTEVSDFLKLCSQYNIHVVPSGGRTGLAGGAVAANGEVVLSLEKMQQLGVVDVASRLVTVEAGAITAMVNAHCKAHGLFWPIEFAAMGSSCIGGNIATNAGGVRVVRYGLTRQWVLGLQVVTMQGEILELNGALEKNNTGIDLRQLFIGSEGILGVITQATLKLAPLPRYTTVAFLAVENLKTAMALFTLARQKLSLPLLAFEYLTEACLQTVLHHRSLQHPLTEKASSYVLLEVEGNSGSEVEAALETFLAEAFEQTLALDGVIARSEKDALNLWALREGISESLSKEGLVHKNDVSLPVAHLVDFVDDLEVLFNERDPDFQLYLFGHMGDGNLHVNRMKPKTMPNEQFWQRCHATDKNVFTLIQKYQGSVSAEHGIGLLKKAALEFSRTPYEIELFKALKKVFDPKNLLNPNKIFDV